MPSTCHGATTRRGTHCSALCGEGRQEVGGLGVCSQPALAPTIHRSPSDSQTWHSPSCPLRRCPPRRRALLSPGCRQAARPAVTCALACSALPGAYALSLLLLRWGCACTRPKSRCAQWLPPNSGASTRSNAAAARNTRNYGTSAELESSQSLRERFEAVLGLQSCVSGERTLEHCTQSFAFEVAAPCPIVLADLLSQAI